MTDIQQDIFQRVSEQNVRWLRKYFFSLLNEAVSVNSLIDTSNRDEYLRKYFAKITSDQVVQLSKALTESSIHKNKKITLLIFAATDDVDVIKVRNKMKEINCNSVHEIPCLLLEYGAFSTEVNQVNKHDETIIVYLSECVADHVEATKVKLSYVIGYFGKDNVVVFCKNTELSDDIKAFIREMDMIYEHISTLNYIEAHS